MRRLAALILLLGTALPASPAAAAARPPAGEFSISPARRLVTGVPPADLQPTVVRNSTGRSYSVDVFPVLLRQTLQGPFTFDERQGPLRDAANLLAVSPSRFTLAPGASRTVRVRWIALPGDRHEASVGIVFQGTPTRVTGAVRTVSRLLSLNFLSDPQAARPQGTAPTLAVRRDPVRPRGVILVASVRNRGGSTGRPGCRPLLRVRAADGHVVRRVRFRADVVVPGARREYPIALPGRLPAGRYSAAVRFCFGSERLLRATAALTLVGDGRLPGAAAKPKGAGPTSEPDAPDLVVGPARKDDGGGIGLGWIVAGLLAAVLLGTRLPRRRRSGGDRRADPDE